MTEPNRRRQPQQARTDVATTGGPEEGTVARIRRERQEKIAMVAQIVQQSGSLFGKLLPEHITAPTFMASAGSALYKNEELMNGALADPDAFMNALREAASLGHVPGSPHYWLTPRKAKGIPSVLGIEGYEGIIERMYRSGGVLSVHARVVRAADLFDPEGGPGGRPLHKFGGSLGAFSPNSERGNIIGVYAYAMLPGGVPSEVMLMSIGELMELRAKNAAGNKIWDHHPEPMYKKSVLRRLEPYVPVSAGYRTTAVQAQSFVAAVAPAAPTRRMEDEAGPDDVIEAPDGAGGGQPQIEAKPVTDVPYDPKAWGGDDPAWESLPVARPGEGIPPEVAKDR